MLVLNRSCLDHSDTRLAVGFVYANYKREAYLWEVVVVVRLVIFSLIAVLFRDDVSLQIGIGLLVLFISVVAHAQIKPFAVEKVDRVEASSLVANWLTLFAGTLLFNPGVNVSVLWCNEVILLSNKFLPHRSPMSKGTSP